MKTTVGVKEGFTLAAARPLIFFRPSNSGLLSRTGQMALEMFALPTDIVVRSIGVRGY